MSTSPVIFPSSLLTREASSISGGWEIDQLELYGGLSLSPEHSDVSEGHRSSTRVSSPEEILWRSQLAALEILQVGCRNKKRLKAPQKQNFQVTRILTQSVPRSSHLYRLVVYSPWSTHVILRLPMSPDHPLLLIGGVGHVYCEFEKRHLKWNTMKWSHISNP